MIKPVPLPRLHLLLASSSDVGLIFRRGPSKRVELVRWDTSQDTFLRGHWFHGRLFEQRSDLSSDGALLVYFASKFSGHTLADPDYTYAWTAVSRPPWLTALALWPKGDCWHGGGHFLGKRRLLLNHRPERATPHPRHRPHGLRVEANPDAHGENEPMYARRLDREGWTVQQPWDVEWLAETFTFRTNAPEIRARQHRHLPYAIRMERRLDGFRYRELYTLEGPAGRVALPLDGADAVNWDQRGRLVVLSAGAVHVAEVTTDRVGALGTLVDLVSDHPEPRNAPAAAQAW